MSGEPIAGHGGAPRRRFVSGALAMAAQAALWPAGPALAAAARPDLAATLAAFLDTLLPRDALSGSASDFGIPARILAESRADRLYARLLRAGCRWLDLAAEGPFGALPASGRILVVEWMAASEWDRVPRRFYELMRERTVDLYYSQPQSWAGLGIATPPQPLGYPEPWT